MLQLLVQKVEMMNQVQISAKDTHIYIALMPLEKAWIKFSLYSYHQIPRQNDLLLGTPQWLTKKVK